MPFVFQLSTNPPPFAVCLDDFSKFVTFQLQYMFGKGVRVYRGPNWQSSYGDIDGGIGQPGTITQALGSVTAGYVQVLWDTGKTGLYRVANGGNYDVCRAAGECLSCRTLHRQRKKTFLKDTARQ